MIGGTLCSVLPGAEGLGTGITDLSLLAHSGWRQLAVAWEMPRRRPDWLSCVGWSYHTASNSQPNQFQSVKCFHENRMEKCLQETEDDWKQLESVPTPATKGMFACRIVDFSTALNRHCLFGGQVLFMQLNRCSFMKIFFCIAHWLLYCFCASVSDALSVISSV